MNRRAALARPAAALLEALGRVRRDTGDEDGVHDARVAARRLLAVAEIWLPASEDRDLLARRLEKVVRRLGPVRNLDVTIGLLSEGPKSDAAARKALLRRAKKKRRAERKELERRVKERRISRLKSAIAAVLHRQDPGEAPAKSSLGRRLKRVLTLAGRGDPLSDSARAHEIRREVRFLRYQFETLEGAWPPREFESLRRTFLRLQDAAGAWRDREIVLRMAGRLKKSAAAPLRKRLEAEREELGREFVKALGELVARKAALAGNGA